MSWIAAGATEFRVRYWTHLVVLVLGFTAPWNYVLHADPTGANAHLWGWGAAKLSEAGALSIGGAFDALLGCGIVAAVAGAWLRTWGAAFLGSEVVQDGAMHAGVVADGPYRHLRNPLYVGTFLHVLALALLMPRSGAVFAVVVIAVMQVRLVLGEEEFLASTQGAAYEAYRRLVPRWWPSLRPRVAGSGRGPRWGQAFLGEIYMWGVAVSFAALGWEYKATLLMQGVVVSFGASLVVRAVKPAMRSAES